MILHHPEHRRGRAPVRALSGGALLAFLSACGPSSGSTQVGLTGELSDGPDGFFVVDDNEGGLASNFLIESIYWGRLVDVLDRTGSGAETLVFQDLVVPQGVFDGQNFDADGDVDFDLDQDAVTGRTRLVIRHPLVTTGVAPNRVVDEVASAEFLEALAFLDDPANFETIAPKSLSAFEIPPYSAVARNAAIVVAFNDLVDPASVTPENVRVFTGVPPINPYEPRLFPDARHGALEGGSFRSTRVVIDLTVSVTESATTAAPVNEIGLPTATTTQKANVALRIPRIPVPSTGQFDVLRNSKGKILSLAGNAPEDQSSETLDVVRAMRSGSSSDPFNGFLPDSVRPNLVARQKVSVLSVPAPIAIPPQALPPDLVGTPDVWLLSFSFETIDCGFTPMPGDQLLFDALPGQTGVLVEILQVNDPPVGGLAADIFVQVQENGATGVPAGGSARFITTFEGTVEEEPFLPCFVAFTPNPSDPPSALVSPLATFTIEFDEAMDPDSLAPFDSFLLTNHRDALDGSFKPASRPWHKVIGNVTHSSDLRRFVYQPALPLSHESGTAESYFVNIITGAKGVRDLAGNTIQAPVAAIGFTLNPSAPQNRTGGYALNFSSKDEDGNSGQVLIPPAQGGGSFTRNRPEVRGQVVLDPATGTLFPRAVTRFAKPIERDLDPDNLQNLMASYPPGPPPSLPSPYDNGVRDPFLRFGSRMMTVWRYADMKLKATDETTYNIDVEELSWSTPLSQTFADTFPHFRISLAHSAFLPDEGVDIVSASLAFPFSGLVTSAFQDNVLVDPLNALTVMHEGFLGYTIDPMQGFQTPAENIMQPFPLNRGIPASQKKYYTWRDTAILAVGGDPSLGPPGPVIPPGTNPSDPQPSGLDILAFGNTGTGNIVTVYADPSATGKPQGALAKAPNIPSIGMPLLMDFQVNPSSVVGLNVMDHGDPWGLFAPVFRIHSSGGFDLNGIEQIKFPSQEDVPDGGYNTSLTVPPIGTPTSPFDSIMYMGQVDFVVRVSRAFTVWIMVHGSVEEELDMQPPVDADPEGNAEFEEPFIDYLGGDPAPGTGVVLHFRGGTVTNQANPQQGEGLGVESPWRNASLLDAYGDEPTSKTYALDVIEKPDLDLSFKYLDPPANKNPSIAFDGGSSWKESISDVDGSQFIQVRMTFISDPVTGGTPVLSGLAIAWDLSD